MRHRLVPSMRTIGRQHAQREVEKGVTNKPVPGPFVEQLRCLSPRLRPYYNTQASCWEIWELVNCGKPDFVFSVRTGDGRALPLDNRVIDRLRNADLARKSPFEQTGRHLDLHDVAREARYREKRAAVHDEVIKKAEKFNARYGRPDNQVSRMREGRGNVIDKAKRLRDEGGRRRGKSV